MTRVMWFVLSVALSCCSQVSTEDCERACQKPYDLTEASENIRINEWKRMPEPMDKVAAEQVIAWQEKLAAEKSKYQVECVSSCLAQAIPADVKCRVRARSTGEWKRCK